MSNIRIKNQIEPVTPPLGRTTIWIDSTTKRIKSKDDVGVITEYGAQPTVDELYLSKVTTINIDFGNEQNLIEQIISDITASDSRLYIVVVQNEELLLQGVSGFVSDIINNVSYKLTMVAPYGASGIYQIKIVDREADYVN